ncbi:MAG: ral secretion pathway protein [Chthoniobacter sp.]|jgi:type II secretory pathway component PulF|nr:ral secretion pathway protein [Chthoniobacter sp.]
MPQFRYVARKPDGKLIDGVLNCNDRSAAIAEVEKQGGVPIKIEPVTATASTTKSESSKSGKVVKTGGTTAPPPSPATAGTTLGTTQQYLFTEQLAHLLTAGMTLDEALGILVRRMKHPKLQSISQGLHRALVDGRSLSQALRDYPRIFSPLYVNLVSAGEVSGALPEILKRLVAHLSDVKSLRDRVQQALVYPAVLVVAGTGLIIVFMTVMVPKLTGFFRGTGQPLPQATQLLVTANEMLVRYWWVALLAGGALYTLFKVFTRSPEGRRAWDYFTWRIPVYSRIIRYRFYAQFARTLGTLIENGVTLLRALELLEEISGNEYIRQRMIDTRAAVVDGATLSTALSDQKIFPELFIDMMAVGEQSGRFGNTMQMIADVYERELDGQIKIVSTLIPPMVMIVIAAIVGMVVYGILSAVFGLTQGLRAGVH